MSCNRSSQSLQKISIVDSLVRTSWSAAFWKVTFRSHSRFVKIWRDEIIGAAYFLVDLTRRLTIPYRWVVYDQSLSQLMKLIRARFPTNSIYYIEASSYFDSQTQGEKVELLSILVPNKFKGRKVTCGTLFHWSISTHPSATVVRLFWSMSSMITEPPFSTLRRSWRKSLWTFPLM